MPIGKLMLAGQAVKVVYLLNDPELATGTRRSVGVSCLDRDLAHFQALCSACREFVLQLRDGTQVDIQIATFWEERPHPSFRAWILGDPAGLDEL
jgi:hypothetical protein